MTEEKDFINRRISIIIPCYNAASTIGKCLEAAFSSAYKNFEVIVVDDCSTDDSAAIIKQFPCKLIRLDKHSGAARARNIGAQNSSGEIFFFTDSDCLLQKNTLVLVDSTFSESENTIIGGTYTKIPYDNNFFSTFQSIFINYFETKSKEPDYIAAHAMAINSKAFRESGGFSENFLPIIEDVEFSHRLKKSGYKLKMNPEIVVQHIFNFTLIKSLKNAFRKSMYWTIYSLKNKDVFKDSGTASVELKINVAACFLTVFLALLSLITKNALILTAIPFISAFNIYSSRRLISAFYNAKGFLFSILAALYYALVYSIPVGAGAIAGIINRNKY